MRPYLIVVWLTAAVFAGCGGGDSTDPTASPPGSATGTGQAAGTTQGVAIFASPEETRRILGLLGDDTLPVFLAGRSRDPASFAGIPIPGRTIIGVSPVSTARLGSPFEAAYVATYGEEPTDAARQAYDAVYLGVLAAASAQSSNPAALSENITYVANPPGDIVAAGPEGWASAIETLASGGDVDLQGASGLIDFDPHGAQTKGAIEVWTLIDGTIAALETRDVDLAAEVGAEVPAGALFRGESPAPPLVAGVLASEGDASGVFEGARLAADEINTAGGILGEPMELTFEDPSVDAAGAAQSLVDAQASFIVGMLDDTSAVSAAEVARGAMVPLFSLSPAVEVEAGDDGNTVFSMTPSETLQTAGLANVAIERDAQIICVLWEEGGAGNALARTFGEAVETKGGTTRGPDDAGADDDAIAACQSD